MYAPFPLLARDADGTLRAAPLSTDQTPYCPMERERVRKLGDTTLTSIGSVARATQVKDQDSTDLEPEAMVSELHADNVAMVKRLKGMKDLAEKAGDNATDGLIDDWTDMAEERAWFLKSTLG